MWCLYMNQTSKSTWYFFLFVKSKRVIDVSKLICFDLSPLSNLGLLWCNIYIFWTIIDDCSSIDLFVDQWSVKESQQCLMYVVLCLWLSNCMFNTTNILNVLNYCDFLPISDTFCPISSWCYTLKRNRINNYVIEMWRTQSLI